MKLYYSAAYTSRREHGNAVRQAVDRLRCLGIDVFAPWLLAEPEDAPHDRAEYARRMTLLDLAAMSLCHVFVEDRRWGQSRHGSMHYERGRAVGMGLRVIVIGKQESIFDFDHAMTFVESEDALENLLVEASSAAAPQT